MDKLTSEFIKRELINRIQAVKLLQMPFDVNNICFTAKGHTPNLYLIGDLEALAKVVNEEVYERDINGKTIRAFEFDGVEVWQDV